MTTDTVSSAAARFLIGRHLKAFREGAELSLREASRALDTAPSQISRVENGDAPVRAEDIELACQAYGITDTDVVGALKKMARNTRHSPSKNWLSSYADIVSDALVLYIGLEAAASALSWYEVDYIPALVQTRDYGRAVMATEHFTGRQLDPGSLDRRLEIRLKRQQILTRSSPPTVSIVIGEHALTRNYGGAATMAGQLEHLLEVSELDNVDLRVMPHDRIHGGLATGQFIVLDFPPLAGGRLDQPSCVYVDSYLGFFMSFKPDEVELHQTVWSNVQSTALDPQQSSKFIQNRLRVLHKNS